MPFASRSSPGCEQPQPRRRPWRRSGQRLFRGSCPSSPVRTRCPPANQDRPTSPCKRFVETSNPPCRQRTFGVRLNVLFLQTSADRLTLLEQAIPSPVRKRNLFGRNWEDGYSSVRRSFLRIRPVPAGQFRSALTPV